MAEFWIQPMTLAQVAASNRRLGRYAWMRDLTRMYYNTRRSKDRDAADWKIWRSAGEWSPADELPDDDERDVGRGCE